MVRSFKFYISLSLYLTSVSSFGGIEHLPTHIPVIQNALTTIPSSTMSQCQESSMMLSSAFTNGKFMDNLSLLASDYQLALKTDPYPTKMATGVVLAVVGDAIAQGRDTAPYDSKRATAFAAFDACYRAVQQFTYPPIIALFKGQFILAFLASLGLTSVPSQVASLMGPLEQTLISQLVIIPTIYYPVFYAVTGAVQGLTFEETIERAKNTFIPLMKRNLMFWIPVQFGAFGFIQEDLQIPVLILMGLIWTVILSVSAGAVKPKAEDFDDSLPEVAMNNINGGAIDGATTSTTTSLRSVEVGKREKVDG